MKTFLARGECMLEFSRADDGGWRLGFAGDTLNTAWYYRAAAHQEPWRVEYFTRLGSDAYSDQLIAFLGDADIGAVWIKRDETRQPGLYLIDTEAGERSFTYWRGESLSQSGLQQRSLASPTPIAATRPRQFAADLALLPPVEQRSVPPTR